MKSRLSLYLLAAVMARGATLTNVSITNTSTPDLQQTGTGVFREFRSELTPGGVVQNGNTSSIQAVLRWVAGFQVLEGGPQFANIMMVTPALEITFTVDDPLNLGYSLSAETGLRGYAHAIYSGGGSGGAMDVTASGVGVTAFFDDGGGFGLSLPITLFGTQTYASVNAPVSSALAVDSGSTILGSYVGTRTFILRMSNAPSPGGTFILQNFVRGETAFRFGLDATYPGFTVADTPDDDTGLSVTLTAAFNADPNPVPEPGTEALISAGLLAVVLTGLRGGKKA